MADSAQDVGKVVIDCVAFFNEEGKGANIIRKKF